MLSTRILSLAPSTKLKDNLRPLAYTVSGFQLICDHNTNLAVKKFHFRGLAAFSVNTYLYSVLQVSKTFFQLHSRTLLGSLFALHRRNFWQHILVDISLWTFSRRYLNG